MDLAVSSRSVGIYSVVAVEGEVDVYSAPSLDEVLSNLIAEGNTRLIVDFTNVGFLDSTGLGVLVKALKRVREAGGSLAVVTSSERVVKVFRITGLDVVMSLVASVDDALATDGS